MFPLQHLIGLECDRPDLLFSVLSNASNSGPEECLGLDPICAQRAVSSLCYNGNYCLALTFAAATLWHFRAFGSAVESGVV